MWLIELTGNRIWIEEINFQIYKLIGIRASSTWGALT